MKNVILILALMLCVSCSPSRYAVHVEMRYPSKSGLDMAGKTISVVYLESENELSDKMLDGMADGFAYSLEQDYATGEGSVPVYSISQTAGAVYSSKDSLVNLLLETGTDVIFLFDTLTVGTLSMGGLSQVAVPTSADSSFMATGKMPFSVRLYAYDSMNKADRVWTFDGSSTAAPHAYSDGTTSSEILQERTVASLPEVGFEAGRMLSSSFVSQWKPEQFSIAYFGSQKWYDAVNYASQYYWKEAMDIWIGLLDTGDLLKRSCAEYNIAVSCFMLGDYDLASQWLDRSDADNKLPYSDSLRKRIEARMQ